MSRYKIGIPGWKMGTNSFGVLVPYLDYIEQFGEAVILSPESDINEDLDLILLPGGLDVDPARYGEKPGYYTSSSNIYLEYFDTKKLPEYIERGTPVLGICRGIQTLGVLFGSKLIQHLKGHPTNGEYDRDKLCHDINIINPHYDIVNRNLRGIKRTFKVNSMHHQAIDRSTLNGPLKLVGLTSEGIVEVVAHESLPVVGVEWHPEEIDDDFTCKIIEFLLENKRSLLR